MNAFRLTNSTVSRLVVSTSSRRPLSTQTNQAVNKLRSVLEDYRQQHYTQEIPSRFKKDIVRAMRNNSNSSSSSSLSSDVVAMDGLHRVLINIGAKDQLAMTELQIIFNEIGDGTGQIPAQRFYQIL